MHYETGVQRQTTFTMPNGEMAEGMEIPVNFDDGSSFTVRIPLNLYTNADYVKSVIDQRAQQIAEIKAHGGDTG